MTGENVPHPTLGPRQNQLLEMFLEMGRQFEITTPGQVHAIDQAISEMQEKLLAKGTRFDTLEDYFYILAGLNVGTVWTSGILEREPDFTVEQVANVLQVSLDGMAPPQAKRFDTPSTPSTIAWYDQASAAIRDLLETNMQLDIRNPLVFNQIIGGMVVGLEWMQGLIRVGYTSDDAAHMTLATFARFAPETPRSS